MKHSHLYRFSLSIVLLLSCLNAAAQQSLGPQRFTNARARQLRDPTTLSAGLHSFNYLAEVGGVAFDQVAVPAKTFKFRTLTIEYRPDRKDRSRMVLTIDGQEVSAPIYDWQLIPIAKFADSQYHACFTLFGRLEDAAREREVRQRGGYVANYHPAFVDTLMGLRLLQLDGLIIHPYSYDLIKNKGRYVLGAGELRPSVVTNQKGKMAFQNFFRSIAYSQFLGQTRQNFTSYVISDQGSRIVFDLKDQGLTLTGQPTYYFWATQPLATGNARAVPVANLSAQVSARPKLLRAINPAVWDANVTLMRYAAFFRYCKQKYPGQWRNFMAQINQAPMPLPHTTTPEIVEPLP
ncbi:MAG: hypothetical protein JWM21_1078 [Acidobacteria bacterium]|nr:hypothetical protein [Acidobacteriota bacterium]